MTRASLICLRNRGPLPPAQTMEGFFCGESIPVNGKLSEIFLQLHISEKSGRGVPKIIELYGKDAYSFRENSIVVTIPFRRVTQVGGRKPLSERRQRIISAMRDNPNITTKELGGLLEINTSAVQKHISFLKANQYIERIGIDKTGHWKVLV